VFRNCTIVGNGFGGSGWTGAGIHLGAANLTLENTIVAFNRNGLDHSGDVPQLTIRNSIFYNPGGSEIIGLDATVLQRNGNATLDPLFVDRPGGNYELAANSPAIDAGRALDAPATDILGRPRFDDLGLENLGAGHPSYVDIGAFERQQSTSPAADLAVVDISATPLDVAPGGLLTATWTIENTGQRNLTENWTDAIYLSSDPYLSTTDDRLLAEVPHTDDLTAGSRYTGTWSGTIPVGISGPLYVIVQTNNRRAFRESVSTNNARTFDRVIAVAVPSLTTASPQAGHVNQGQWTYYRFEAEPGRTIRFALNSAVASGAVHLYLRREAIPTVSNYDVAATAFNQPDQELRLLTPSEGVYYLGVFGQSLAAGGTDFTLTAEPTSLAIRQVDRNSVGNAGKATVKLVGDNFTRGCQVTLIAPDGTTIIQSDEWFQDASTLFATFDLAAASAAAGLYDVVVTDPGVASVTKFDALTVQSGGSTNFSTNLVVPGTARPGREVRVTVEYSNTGTIDVLSPLLTLESSDGAAWLLPGADPDEGWIDGSSVSFVALSSDGPASILRPGQTQTLTITARTPLVPGDVPFTLYSFGTPGDAGVSQAINWSQLGADIRPPDTSDDAWVPFFERLKAQVGTTWGDYLNVLRDNADGLAQIDQRVYDSAELFAFEVVQAATIGTPGYLEGDRDAFCPAPGLPLSFDRYFLPGPSYRARLGSLGRGWTHSYEITLLERSDGSVVINGPSGFDRIFEPDGQGGYKAAAGDNGRLTSLPDEEFLLGEQNGLQTHFRSDGRFDSIEDTNGNRIFASYDAQGKLVVLAHSNGDRFRLEYDAAGRLVKLTDHANRVTRYTYDATGEHLLSVTQPGNEITTYSYLTGAGVLKDHSLLTISRPGGPQVSFSYDSLGRLATQHIAASQEPIIYTYGTAGRTAVTDAFGNTTSAWLDSRGRTAMTEDPLGYRSQMYYDAASNLIRVVGPTGLSSQFTYDGAGNLIVYRDPIGYETAFGYGGLYNDLLWDRDAPGNATTYAYDDRSNLASITYVDGTVESYQYDGLGNLIAYTNRRGQTITYAYNSRGQLTSKDYPDTPGVVDFHYAYDTAGNMVSSSGPEGMTTFTYEPNTDRLLRIDYPLIGSTPLFFIFEYDAAGRRMKRTDQDGHVVNVLFHRIWHKTRQRLSNGLLAGQGQRGLPQL
jgi:YD repeat-containing protein